MHDKDPRSLWLADDKSADPEAEAEGESEPESEGKSAYAESESEPEGESGEKSLEDLIEEAETDGSSEEVVRKARKIINKSIDVSIGYVTHSVSTGKRRKRQAEETNKGKLLFLCS